MTLGPTLADDLQTAENLKRLIVEDPTQVENVVKQLKTLSPEALDYVLVYLVNLRGDTPHDVIRAGFACAYTFEALQRFARRFVKTVENAAANNDPASVAYLETVYPEWRQLDMASGRGDFGVLR